jgi:hypothetical protein
MCSSGARQKCWEPQQCYFFFMKLKMYKIQGKLNFRNNHILKFKEK